MSEMTMYVLFFVVCKILYYVPIYRRLLSDLYLSATLIS
jgi:hypothetical protein